ncbi:MAG TPA: FAD-dependent oxidoreductase, partial [Gemmatimonadales bacterium]|nr:FAD-dependent oxidoreductase [Gemmatimonadales bacterium]
PAPGWIVEAGPDGVLASDPDVPALAAELGIADHLVPQSDRGAQLWDGKTRRALAEGEAARLLGIRVTGDLAAGFVTFAGGMEELPAALAAALGERIRYRVGVTGLVRQLHGFRVSATGGTAFEADAVVVACPAFAAGRVVRTVDGEVAHALEKVRFEPRLAVTLAYRTDQVGESLTGTGFVTEPGAPGHLRACSYASRKFPGRAPSGHTLLRAFLTPVAERAVDAARLELERILRISGNPLWTRMHERPRGVPRPRAAAENAELSEELRSRLERHPGLAVAGAGVGQGVSVGACIRSGRAAARAVLNA